MRYLLDTSAAIILRDTRFALDDALRGLASIPAFSIVTVVELEGGVVKVPALAAVRRKLLDRMLARFPVLEFDAACVARYRQIVEAIGFSRPKLVDRMIAATALAHDLAVITTNPRDFRDVPGLAVEAWQAPASSVPSPG